MVDVDGSPQNLHNFSNLIIHSDPSKQEAAQCFETKNKTEEVKLEQNFRFNSLEGQMKRAKEQILIVKNQHDTSEDRIAIYDLDENEEEEEDEDGDDS